MTETATRITGGVDTHRDVHVVAALDERGALLDTNEFPATAAGYHDLVVWLGWFGPIDTVGVEGTGTYGAGLARHLMDRDIDVVEVDRPNRQRRRRAGKSDTTDAISAARAALSGEASTTAKTRDGNVEKLRVLRIARRSIRHDRVRALNQLRAMVVTAPPELREHLTGLTSIGVAQAVNKFRVADPTSDLGALKYAMRSLGRRAEELRAEAKTLDKIMRTIIEDTAPALIDRDGIGVDAASALLVAAGDNPERLHSEAGFARLCGAAPLEASSGMVTRHRLSRAGNRQANSALYRIVINRMSNDQRTRIYVTRRRDEGKSNLEIIRCLKRYVAREVYPLLAITS
ncbi:MAG TPA: IS110 family transposase [Acidimicrobiales bacterium]